MEEREYQGAITPENLAQALLDAWDHDTTIAQAFGEEDHVIVQIGQRQAGFFSDEPRQALTLTIEPTGDGVRVRMGQQQWYKEHDIQVFGGGMIGLFPFFIFPLGQLFGGGQDEIDQGLPAQIWYTIDQYAVLFGSQASTSVPTADAPAVAAPVADGPATGVTRRLRTVSCSQCGVANPENAEHCSACGASLAAAPVCPNCQHLNPVGASFCNRCGTQLGQPVPTA